MKFYIFKWWERWAKPIMIAFILLITAGLFVGYFVLDSIQTEVNSIYVFAAPVVYALILFAANFPFSRLQRSIDEKLYDRESCYLSIKRLRDVTNATIAKISDDDHDGLISAIIGFQVFTGRDEATLEAIAKGEKAPHFYVKENGFLFKSKLLSLENEVRKGNNNKSQKKLKSEYKHICKQIDKNIQRLEETYGGALKRLVEEDEAISDSDFYLRDVLSNMDDIQSSLNEISDNVGELDSEIRTIKSILSEELPEAILERIDDLESVFDSMSEITEVRKTND